jgi:ABC-type multidrug transport system fused ATPase/permease subunit
MRLRRVRFARLPKRSDDTGPLALRQADGSTRIHPNALPADLATAGRIDMAYPRASDGGLTLTAWIKHWPHAATRAARLTDAALGAVPALLALLPFMLFEAPNDLVRVGLIVAMTLLLIAYRRSDNRQRRDESLLIHARFWDQMLRSPPPPADPDDLSTDSRTQAHQLKLALEAALITALARRRIIVGAVTLAVLLAALSLCPDALPVNRLAAALGAATALGMATAYVTGRLRTQLEQETDDLTHIEARYLSHMPLMRQLGLGEQTLAELDHAGMRRSGAALWVDLARVTDKLLPGVVAAGALVFTLADSAADIPTLLLLSPAVFCATRLGQTAGRLVAALGRITAARALLFTSAQDDDAAALILDEVALSGIRFAHDEIGPPLIDNLLLTLKRGDVVALTGPSGCGKSTLLEILAGLSRPQSGSISINGEVRRWQSLSAYRSRIGVVFQDRQAGASTIRAAVTADAAEASEAEILRAIDDAGLSETIAALPMGLETLLVEGALPASLMQQVLIARTLAWNPDLILLDETLSNLDLDVARRIIAAARRRNMTLLFATHREDLAALADRRIDLPPQMERFVGIAG